MDMRWFGATSTDDRRLRAAIVTDSGSPDRRSLRRSFRSTTYPLSRDERVRRAQMRDRATVRNATPSCEASGSRA